MIEAIYVIVLAALVVLLFVYPYPTRDAERKPEHGSHVYEERNDNFFCILGSLFGIGLIAFVFLVLFSVVGDFLCMQSWITCS